MSKLLFNEHPLVILPELAVRIGLNEAIVLQQIHYWLQKSDHIIEGQRWVYNSVEDWSKQFPFFSPSTVRRTLEKLTADKYLTTGCFNKLKMDKTKWYTINYSALECEQETAFVNTANRSVQIEQMESSTTSKRLGLVEQMESPKLSEAIPETTQKLTPETTTTTTTANDDGGDVKLKINSIGDISWYLRATWGKEGSLGHNVFNGPEGLNAFAKEIGLEELQICIDIAAESTPDKRSVRYLKGIVAKRAAERIEKTTSVPTPGQSNNGGLAHFVCDTCGRDGSMQVSALIKHRGETFGCEGCETRHSVNDLLKEFDKANKSV